VIDHLLHEARADVEHRAAVEDTWRTRSAAILAGCFPKQQSMILDPARKKGLRCPRRAGKSYGLSSLALHVGESAPNKRILIISLTLKSTRENYWAGAPGGIFTLNTRYGLNLKFNHTDSVWVHENGSRGRLAGAETRADIEYLRGAAAEADVAIVDECKSFAPDLLRELIQDILQPGLMTRRGTLILGGTPGLIPQGVFFDATHPEARTEHGAILNIPWDLRESRRYADADPRVWSLHSWDLEDNTSAPWQWEEALINKQTNGWADDHPTWLREYRGQWVTDSTGLVYAYAALRAGGKVTWFPAASKANPTGLPTEHGPWHTVLGVDFGYEDDFALVLSAYSEQIAELRVVYEYKSKHLTIEKMVAQIQKVIDRYGQPSAIVGDAGGLGKLVIESINQMYAIPIEKAEKTEKFDHIELLNSDFHAGRIKIIPNSAPESLETELCGLQWDLSKESKEYLVRRGKLREDPGQPNHLCDALLYSWRYAFHHFARPVMQAAERGSPEWLAQWDAEQARRAAAHRLAQKSRRPEDLRHRGTPALTRQDAEWRLTRPR